MQTLSARHPAASEVSLMRALLAARLHDPFSYLGPHKEGDSSLVRVFYPDAINVWVNIRGNF
ncbi:MAG TPA: hypothetical protein VF243_00145, partial [Nitrosospira sp.]